MRDPVLPTPEFKLVCAVAAVGDSHARFGWPRMDLDLSAAHVHQLHRVRPAHSFAPSHLDLLIQRSPSQPCMPERLGLTSCFCANVPGAPLTYTKPWLLMMQGKPGGELPYMRAAVGIMIIADSEQTYSKSRRRFPYVSGRGS